MLTSRVFEDLGVDGQDAVIFFQAFAEEFNVDLTILWDHWEQHFAPEGGPGWAFAVGCFACFLIGAAIRQVLSLLPFWAYGSILCALWVWPLRCWPFTEERSIPITVQELMDAAKEGRWVKAYDVHMAGWPKLETRN